MAITHMQQYLDYSFEELRVQDYEIERERERERARERVAVGAQSVPAFGAAFGAAPAAPAFSFPPRQILPPGGAAAASGGGQGFIFNFGDPLPASFTFVGSGGGGGGRFGGGGGDSIAGNAGGDVPKPKKVKAKRPLLQKKG
jgi:hypothetical protein